MKTMKIGTSSAGAVMGEVGIHKMMGIKHCLASGRTKFFGFISSSLPISSSPMKGALTEKHPSGSEVRA
jgi:hypothetical protein